MSADTKTPGIPEFLKAYGDAIVGQRDPLASVRRGGGYDMPGGMNALLMGRQARRIRWLFRQGYEATAEGFALEQRVERAYGGTERVQATRGTGRVILRRPAGAAGTIYTGTRIEVVTGSALPPGQYRVSHDFAVTAQMITFPVPIEAARTGTGTAVRVTNQGLLRLADSVFDVGLFPVALDCADGADRESDAAYLARAKQEQQDTRPGYRKSITQACLDAGAVYVVMLDPGTFGDDQDFGLSYVYVADAGFSTASWLQKVCALALDDWRVAGCDAQVLGMVPTDVALAVAVSLVDDPSLFDIDELRTAVVEVLLDEFNGRREFWTFRNDALAGALQQMSQAVQTATVVSTPAEPALAFPDALPRYTLKPSAITLTFTGPT